MTQPGADPLATSVAADRSAQSRPNLRIAEAVLDCNRPEVALAFWEAALGYERGWAGGPFAELHDPQARGLTLLFQQVPEAKIVKNRVHLDLTTPDMPREVARLSSLGAGVLREVSESGARWTVMTDPEGNEFCVVAGSPPAE
jgi:predicted enzyme related to lactoylglutathione lyase